MENKNEQSSSTAGREVVMARTVAAPRELVYKVWTEPEHIAKWWGPNGFTNTVYEMNVIAGGAWRYMMHGPDGTDFPNRIRYSEVIPNEKLAYVHDSGIDNDPDEFHVTVTFETVGACTKITMRSLFADAARLEMLIRDFGVLEGGKQTLNHLEAYLVGMDETSKLTIVREFNAPRELVFKAWTEPGHLAHWWGPKGMQLSIIKFELKPGGHFHYSMEVPDGNKMWGRFVYREISAPEKIIFTSSFADENGDIAGNPWLPVWPAEILNIVAFTEQNGKTLMVLKGGPVSATDAEIEAYNNLKANMQQGFAGTFDALDAYLADTVK